MMSTCMFLHGTMMDSFPIHLTPIHVHLFFNFDAFTIVLFIFFPLPALQTQILKYYPLSDKYKPQENSGFLCR